MCAFPGVKLLPMFQPPNRQTINNQIFYSIDYVSMSLLILIFRNIVNISFVEMILKMNVTYPCKFL